MVIATVKSRLVLLAASACIAFGGAAFAKDDPTAVKEEEGFYYGYGKGSTKEEALAEGKKDLIETALTAAVRSSNPKASRVKVSADSASARLLKAKPFAQDKPGTKVVYRVKVQDWEKAEAEFSQTLRESLAPKYESFAKKNDIADKLNAGVEILGVLASNGVTDLLTVQAGGTELFSRKVEAGCAQAVKSLNLALSEKDGFIGPDTKFHVTAANADGKPVAGLNLKAEWEVSSLLGEEESPSSAVSFIKTDSLGNADIDYPVSEDFKGRCVVISVSTAFADTPTATAAMKKLDASEAVDGNYIYMEDIAKEFAAAQIPAGEFMAGAVPQDGKARKVEASHKAETGSYEILLSPVTNAQFAAFLHATRSESRPEYLDNSDFNQASQPVIGVSVSDAEAYAQWLSEQTGAKYRLPTEEEWEKAARDGKETVYPWGDEAPNKSKRANYKGNGKYKFTSPQGAFENGANGLGILDMAGNVWEWTSTSRSEDGESSLRTVKGGSWMDGPSDLRISNFKEIDAQAGYPDVGFRLVREQ